MEVRDKVVVVTGAASGIGAALARRFKAEGARAVALADLPSAALTEVAAGIEGLAVPCNVTCEPEVQALVARVEAELGPIDIFCSNAGILHLGEEDAPDAEWQAGWNVHVMAHVYAVRAVAPLMAARGGGYLLHTASSAGLLSHPLSASYATTKRAAVAFAEWVSIKYRHRGVRVSVLAPQSVRTPMIEGPGKVAMARDDGLMTPEQLADCVMDGLERETFLILPHPMVREYLSRKTHDIDRWLDGMNRWRRKSGESPASP
ncbi:MAG: SDR family NAD(P)-dependent oxidoreductase [Gammaproteobacteria bacterium]|nr:SDR family NAD(P)-dependent oxidoreductase [Gammaproteobacteria bacterium]